MCGWSLREEVVTGGQSFVEVMVTPAVALRQHVLQNVSEGDSPMFSNVGFHVRAKQGEPGALMEGRESGSCSTS